MWKKFDFFTSELLQNENPTSNLYTLQAMDITCVAGGNGQLFFCDSEGGITICNQNYSVKRFQAHQGCIHFAYLYKSLNMLLTVASSTDCRSKEAIEQSWSIANQYRQSLYANPKYDWMMKDLGLLPTVTLSESPVVNEMKVWRIGSADENGNPVCAHSFQFFTSSSEVLSSLAVNEENEIIALGCESGNIYLMKGSVLRNKGLKPTLLSFSHSSRITNLHFSDNEKSLLLYVTSLNQTGVFKISATSSKSVSYSMLDGEHGCQKGCSCVTEKGEFIVGRDTGLFRYRNGEECGCYAIEGPKQAIGSFKDCLLVGSAGNNGRDMITIYNIEAHFIEYQGLIGRNDQSEQIAMVFTEWGDLFISTTQHSVFCLHKIDLQSKLNVFYKEKLFTLALTVACNNNLYYNSIVEIHKLYGDYLCEQLNYDDAVEEYIKTIGYIEPSYVIRKFLDAQRLPNLTSYLEALHQQGVANSEHTTFLLKCYSKLKEKDKLKEFVYNEKNNLKYDIPTAIKVLDDVDCDDEALFLAKKYNYFRDYTTILIKKQHKYEEAVKYINHLTFNQAESVIQEFGHILLDEEPELTLSLITMLCIDYHQIVDEEKEEPSETPVVEPVKKTLSLRDSIRMSFKLRKTTESSTIAAAAPAILATLGEQVLEPVYGNPSQYIHLFSSHPYLLKRFLQQVIQRKEECDKSSWNTYLELVLRDEYSNSEVVMSRNEVMDILTNPRANYDEEEALVLVQTYNCNEGQLFLYKKMKMYNMLLEYYVVQNDSQNAIALCKQYDSKDNNLWVQLLTVLAQAKEVNLTLIHEILDYVDKTQVLPLLYALQILSQNENITLDMLRKYIVHHIQKLKGLTSADKEKINDLTISNQGLKREMTSLVNGARLFQATKCSNCSLPLELPTVHYVCGHSYHKGCMLDPKNGCTRCAYKFKSYMDLPPAPTEEEYFNAMKVSKDGFGVTADFFGKRMFSNLEMSNQKKKDKKNIKENEMVFEEFKM